MKDIMANSSITTNSDLRLTTATNSLFTLQVSSLRDSWHAPVLIKNTLFYVICNKKKSF